MKRWTIVCSLSLLGVSGALAIPETVVFMPTANLNSPRSVYLATEQYGAPRYYSQTRTRCFYTQLTLTERFDFGVDFVGLDNNQPRQTLGNARFVLTPESKRSPGVAVGAMSITDNANPTFYLVGTQTVSFGRFHLGAYRQGDSTGWSGAFQTLLPFGLEVALEYYRFPDGNAYTSVGEKDAFASALSTSAGNGASATSRANHAVVSSVNTPPRRKPYPSSTRSKNITK